MRLPLCLIATLLVAASAVAALPRDAKAETSEAPPAPATRAIEPDPWARAFDLRVHLAPFGSPVGILGTTVGWAPDRAVTLEVGAGVGIAGAQLSGGVRVRPVIGAHWALSLEGGLSRGSYKPIRLHFLCDDSTQSGCTDGEPTFSALWVNTQVAAEYRSDGAFTMSFGLGVSGLVASRMTACDFASASGCTAPTSQERKLLILDVAAGWAF